MWGLVTADPYPVQNWPGKQFQLQCWTDSLFPKESLHYPLFSCICLTWMTSLFEGLEWIGVIANLQYSRYHRFGMTNFSCNSWKCHPFGLHLDNHLSQGFSHLRMTRHLSAISVKLEECCQLNRVCQIIKKICNRRQINTNNLEVSAGVL